MGMQNSSFAPRRWGRGLKIVAIGWITLLFSAWLHGEITAGLVWGAVASGVFWTVGSFLESAPQDLNRYGGRSGTHCGSKPATRI